MTQEEKQLLLIDLCTRLPYRVKVKLHGEICTVLGYVDDFIILTSDTPIGQQTNIVNVKPYLRPMSSMTEEEREELSDYLCEKVMSNKIGITIPPNPTQGKGIPFIWMGDCLDWLNAHHFDYRGLIEKGLALEAPEDMYNIK